MIGKREGLMLYWCEGDKYTNGAYKVAVTSSEPRMIKLFIEWVKRYYDVVEDQIRLRLHVWDGTNLHEAQVWWLKQLNINVKFTKPYIKKRGRKNKFPHGICRASLNSKEILLRILEEIKNEFGLAHCL
jgi:hypothetical protein